MTKKILILLALLSTSALAQLDFRYGEGEYSIEKIIAREQAEKERQKEFAWTMNPLSLYMSQQTYNEVIVASAGREVDKRYGKGRIITIDTRDEDRCESIKSDLLRSAAGKTHQLEHLCDQDEDNPYSSLVVVENKSPLSLDNLSPVNRELVRQTRNFGALGVATMGILFMLPESVTNWSSEDLKKQSLTDRWKEKVSEGPVVDKDDWVINYIGHPLSGAAYYTVARHAGAGVMKSFGYSVLMSTFFWEYGLEAFAETPSIQDLIITPLIGSLLGEGMFYVENKIRENGGVLFGSKRMGAFAMGLMNPAGALLDFVNRPFETEVFKSSEINFTMMPPKSLVDSQGQNEFDSYYLGLELEFKF